MKIGILADSHDNLFKLEKAVKFFNKKKVDFVFHAGDFIAPFTISKLRTLISDWLGVFGNNDGEKVGLTQISEERIKEAPFRIELDGRKIILVHDINIINLDQETVDLIICGHTHKPEIKSLDKKLIVNPGECGGWLTGRSTVAVIDLNSLSCNIFNI